MKTTISVIFGMAAVCAAIVIPAVTADAPAQLPARAQFDTPTATKEVVALLYNDGSWATVTPAPMATNTPTATEEPTREPTSTVTPSRTPTATPTATPPVASTPTQETTAPPPTFTVTPMPAKSCSLRAAGVNINARQSPNTTAAKTGLWLSGIEQTIGAFAVGQGYLWGLHGLGWSVVGVYNAETNVVSDWWVNGTLDSGACIEVEGWPDGLQPPAPIARKLDGFHLIVGAQQVLLNYVGNIGTMKATTHSDQIPLMAKQINPDIVIVYRSLYNANGQIDGPTTDEWYNPYIYWQKLKPFLVGGFDYYEFINEWGGVSRSVIADFNIAMLDLMGRDGYCGLAFSDGPGNPEIPAWDEYIRVLRWIDDHPCGRWPDGSLKYHGIALHQAGKLPDWLPTLPDNYSKNPWIYARLEIANAYLELTQGYDLHDFHGPIYITEMGFEDYTLPNESFTCEEVRAGLDDTRALYADSGLVTGFHIWNFRGPDGQWWVDLTPCLAVMYG